MDYNPNPCKCILIVKSESVTGKAQELFGKYGMEITTKGKGHLGTVVESSEFKQEYMQEQIKSWVQDV